MRKTKIICTLGPSTDDPDILKKLVLAGMDVARINFSHQTHEQQKVRVDTLKALRAELGLPVALLADTKGPEIRLGSFASKSVELTEGQLFTLTTQTVTGTNEKASISYKKLPLDVKKGTKILIDDGLIEMTVESVSDTEIACMVNNGGVVSNNKGINVPNIRLSMPYLSSVDRADLRFIVEQGFDFIAASFTRTADDIRLIKDELARLDGNDTRIIAKIENHEGVDNIDEILEIADGIMVARGDMGVEIPLQEIPSLQKRLITKCFLAGKPVITATQMLESMVSKPRPTRAETTDVANAIYDGTSAIMLSGETAAGMYPIEALNMMDKIARRTEADIDYVALFQKRGREEQANITNAISHATCMTAHDLNAAAILTVTESGQTARMLSKYRPQVPIIAYTTSDGVMRQLNLSWGISPFVISKVFSTDELFSSAVDTALEKGLIRTGDIVAITAGVPLGQSGTTNLIRVHVVGEPI